MMDDRKLVAIQKKQEQIRKLQNEIKSLLEDGTCGEQRDIVVYINHNLEEYDISLIHQIEEKIDKALSNIGFERSTTTKGDLVELVYWQFARAF